MRGILGWGVHLPYRRLDRTAIAAVAGTGGGTGTRAVASYDEDTTTMGVAAARAALAVRPRAGASVDAAGTIRTLWFATTAPAYQDRTNATALHAALRLPRTTAAYDATGAVRSTVAALDAALSAAGTGTHLVVASDLRTGRPGSADEAAGGDAAAALLIGDEAADAPVLAELTARTSVTEEFLDRWRAPGDQTSKTWEDRFGETRYTTVATEAWNGLLTATGLAPDAIDVLVIAGTHERAAKSVLKKTGVPGSRHHDPFATDGRQLRRGTPRAAARLSPRSRAARPDHRPARAGRRRRRLPLAHHRSPRRLPPGTPRRRPDRAVRQRPLRPLPRLARVPPGRAAAPPRARPHLRLGRRARHRLEVRPRRHQRRPTAAPSTCRPRPSTTPRIPPPTAEGTIVTFTVDRLAYSPSPPVVFAVVDFDGGGRLPDRAHRRRRRRGRDRRCACEATFRRLSSADGIHNYFWKARPVRRPAARPARPAPPPDQEDR